MEEIHERLRAELEARGYTKPVMAARAAGLENSQGLRDVLAGRKRLSTELLALLSSTCGVDADYVTTGVRRGEEHLTPLAQEVRYLRLASHLANELYLAKTGLDYEHFFDAFKLLIDKHARQPQLDDAKVVAEIRALLGR